MQNRSLQDKEKRKEINEDLIFITLKIYIKNLLKIVRLIIQIMFIIYFVGNVWFVLVLFQGNFLIMQ